MAEYTVDVGTLTASQQSQAADLVQKLASLDGALAEIQTTLANFQMDINAKTSAIQNEKNKVTMELRALRTATVR